MFGIFKKKKKVVTKIGDVFCVDFRNGIKGHFQYVANDFTQLNSSVIRAFNTLYPIDQEIPIEEIVNDDIAFYSHAILKFGVDEGAWSKIGNTNETGEKAIDRVTFLQRTYNTANVRHFDDWWWAWHINEEMEYKPESELKLRDSVELGSVMTYTDIVFRLFSGYYPFTNPVFSFLRRTPRPEYTSYIEYEQDGKIYYLRYKGNELDKCVYANDGKIEVLDKEEAISRNIKIAGKDFSDTNWEYRNFLTRKQWDKACSDVKYFESGSTINDSVGSHPSLKDRLYDFLNNS
ncbi:MAG: hypothetical protein HDS89_03565 [Bacteroidales bacterium]|nr:hypothetical protein [Bacteroidales bacterium]